MQVSTLRNGLVIGFLGVGALVGCAQHSGSGLPFVPAYSPGALPDASLPKCNGQKETKQYAEDTETISTGGGHLCTPVFGGFGGTIPYASANPSITVTLITSTTNYNHKLPQLGKGTVLAYEQLVFAKGSAFGKNAKGNASVMGAKIVVGNTYSLFSQFNVNGHKINGMPCYSVATKGKYGGVLDLGSSPLEGRSIQAKTTIIAEIYAGKQATQQCS